MLDEFTPDKRIAYFSMEIAFDERVPTYAGGLGVLAGDVMRTACDLELPLVAVTLVSRRGYFRQEVTAQGEQRELPQSWEPRDHATPLRARVAVEIEGRQVWVGGWLHVMQGHSGGRQPLILLDTDLEGNEPADREITHYLYGGDESYRIKQEIVLGIGGVRMLDALQFRVRQYHMNEGHSALLGIELLRRHRFPADTLRPGETPYDVRWVRELCCFTTHTPVEAGHDRFAYELVRRILGVPIDEGLMRALAGSDAFNMTRLALNLSEYVNGVTEKHASVSRAMFPGYRIHAISNGAHPFTWTAEPFRVLYDRYLPGWCHQPELLVRADRFIPDAEIWQAHLACRQRLFGEVERRTGVKLDPERPVICAARRMTAYKRPDLLFADLQRLRSMAERHPFQVVLAGKAHPHDVEGKRLIRSLHDHIGELRDVVPVVFLPDYDMALARVLVAGADLWLNTPCPPMEASGTSGMKAACNGVPSLSIPDGWWLEGCIEGVTGWSFGDGADGGGDATRLCDKLEREVLPVLCGERGPRLAIMRAVIAKNAALFSSHRMMRRYASEAYLR